MNTGNFYIPKFKSEEAEKKFYKNWTSFFRIVGIVMVILGFYRLIGLF